jgi:hypothetical protein
MYRVIETHIDQVLDTIHIERDIQSYVWLREQFSRVDVSTDRDFQRRYRRYWQLNAAHLCESFLQAYFSLLEQTKSRSGNLSLERVVRSLYEIPSQGNGRRTLQFSFATKLIHMLAPDTPIYDSTVEAFYFLPAGLFSKHFDKRLQLLLRAHAFLQREYQRILRDRLLNEPIAAFRDRYDPDAVFTEEKIIDTLIWRCVTLLRRGAIMDGRVAYL